MPKANAAALKALDIDDTLAEAHASLGYIKLHYDWDLQGKNVTYVSGTKSHLCLGPLIKRLRALTEIPANFYL